MAKALSSSKSEVAQREFRKIATLKPYPRQGEVFDPLPPEELRQLAASIKAIGLQHPLDILPDGTIIGGHSRLAAVKLLGWEEVPVRVRHDLVGMSDAELDQVFIEDNLNRRQMDIIQIARAYKALKSKPLPRDRVQYRGDLRDRLAKRFGKSGRMLDRYVRLLDLPRPLQLAVSCKHLTLVQGEQLLRLDEDELSRIAGAYEQGKPIVGMLPIRPSAHPANELTTSAVRSLHTRVIEALNVRRSAQLPPLTKSQTAALRRLNSVIAELLASAGRT